MTIVKELNNLSEKMTGTNAKAHTDAQAVKYIADNYTSGGGGYVLPTASADTLGGIKVGENLTITNGVLSASGGGSISPATIDISTYSGVAMDAFYDNNIEYMAQSVTDTDFISAFDSAISAYANGGQVILVDGGMNKYLANDIMNVGSQHIAFTASLITPPSSGQTKGTLTLYSFYIQKNNSTSITIYTAIKDIEVQGPTQ